MIDPTDQHHAASKDIADYMEQNKILLPWPCLYETVSTHLVRRRDLILHFEAILSKNNVFLLADDTYKDEAFRQVFLSNKYSGYSYSLVDCVLREILKDMNVKINFLLTFNKPDFKDVCDQRQIEIIN